MSSPVKAAMLLTAAFLLGTAVGALGHAIFQVRGVDTAFAQTFVSPLPVMEPCTRADDFDDDVAWARTTTLQLLKDRLGLTDQQARDIEVMRQARRDAVRRDAQTLCEARAELWVLIASADSDPTVVRAAAEKAKVAHARMLDHQIDGKLDLRTLLTLEQWAGWVELLESVERSQHQ
jgi:Spy/CpxP family protein refolding chaperone